jgi:predicted GNAT family acetyltransferase
MIAVPVPEGFDVRRLLPNDEPQLGQLMADAYRGGVEDHGESPEAHAAEARHTVAGGYGTVLWHASFWASRGGVVAGATVVSDWQEVGETGLSFALVHPDSRGRGLGGALISASGAALAAAGHRDWVLAVVPDNPARFLYQRLGFRVFDPRAPEGGGTAG